MDKSALKGVIETHVHTGPESYKKRKFSDEEMALDAESVGARAIVIKSHVFETAARAQLLNDRHPNVRFFGGIALNEWMGGFNPRAVDATLNLGGKFVWLPTISAKNDREALGKKGGMYCLDEKGRVLPELEDILKQIAAANAVLATGHISYIEEKTVIERAKELGVNKIVVNHPELYRVRLNLEQHRELLQYGVYFERNYTGTERPMNPDWIKHMPLALENIKALGAESTILGTDVGQPTSPIWSDTYLECMQYLSEHGVSQQDLDLITKINPAKLLDLEV